MHQSKLGGGIQHWLGVKTLLISLLPGPISLLKAPYSRGISSSRLNFNLSFGCSLVPLCEQAAFQEQWLVIEPKAKLFRTLQSSHCWTLSKVNHIYFNGTQQLPSTLQVSHSVHTSDYSRLTQFCTYLNSNQRTA